MDAGPHVGATTERRAARVGARAAGVSRPRHGVAVLGLLLLFAGTPLAAPAVSAQTTAVVAEETPRRVWLDPEGAPLPFRADDELMEFLRTAAVVSYAPMS